MSKGSASLHKYEVEFLVIGGQDTAGESPLTLPVLIDQERKNFLIPLLSLNWFAGKKTNLTIFNQIPNVSIQDVLKEHVDPKMLDYIFRRMTTKTYFKAIYLSELIRLAGDGDTRQVLRKQLILTDEQYDSLVQKGTELINPPFSSSSGSEVIEVEVDEDDSFTQLLAYKDALEVAYNNFRTKFWQADDRLEKASANYKRKRKHTENMEELSVSQEDDELFTAEILYNHIGDRMVRARTALFRINDEIKKRLN